MWRTVCWERLNTLTGSGGSSTQSPHTHSQMRRPAGYATVSAVLPSRLSVHMSMLGSLHDEDAENAESSLRFGRVIGATRLLSESRSLKPLH